MTLDASLSLNTFTIWYVIIGTIHIRPKMDDDIRTERERRTDDAMERAVDALDALQLMTDCTKTLPAQTMFGDYVDEMKGRAKELDEELDKKEQLLLKELCKFLNHQLLPYQL